MRIENTRTADIGKIDANINAKGSTAVSSRDSASQKQEHSQESAYSVKNTTVEKALFSFDSQLEKIRQAAGTIDVDTIKTQMAVLSNTVSPEDMKKLEEGGYSLNDTQLDTIVTVMDKIKMELAKGGMDISVFGDDYSLEQLEAITGNTAQARQMASSLTGCEDSDIKYMLDNELSPTVDQLYKAKHSGSKAKASDVEALKQEDGLLSQVEQMLKQAGLPVNDTTLGYGSFLLNNEIPVTPDNLKYMDKLKNLKLPVEEQALNQAFAQAASEGKKPEEALLLEGYSHKDRAIAAAETVEQATDDQLAYVVEHELPMNLDGIRQARNALSEDAVKNSASQAIDKSSGSEREALTVVSGKAGSQEAESQPGVRSAQEDLSAKQGRDPQTNQQDIWEEEGNPVSEADLKLVTARRQLEEIRLAMTAQANYQLIKQGITIETMDLEQLVEQLKGIEQNYYRTLLSQSGVEPSQQNIDLFQETVEKTSELKELPAYALRHRSVETATINSLHEAGTAMKASMEEAGEAYETMMTTPRSDLGDSIKKAFRNVDEILKDMNLEITEPNQRAVRILGYNGLEITPESVSQMKAADQKVQLLMQNMTPSVVMEFIREGINPLETDVSTLSAKAQEIQANLDPGQEEKYSKYLWELEQKQGITPEQRESYIGIYRMLHQIEKSDGAAIGALVNQGGELSLKNLLTAVRSRKAGGMDVKADEGFGGLEELVRSEATITQQVEASYQTDCAKEAFGRMNQGGMEQVMADPDWQEMTPEQLLWLLKEERASEDGQNGYQESRRQDFQSCRDAEASLMRTLANYDMPLTTYNLMAVGQMVNNRNGIFRNLFDKENLDQHPDLSEAKDKLLSEFAEAVKTPEDMAKAQKVLADTAEQVMETMINEKEMTSLDVRDMKLLRQQIELSTKMSKEENYAIPVLIADEMTNVQLKIVRGKEKTGRVDIMFQTDRLGKVAAKLQAAKGQASGYVASDSQEAVNLLKTQGPQMQDALEQAAGSPVRVDFIQSSHLNLSEFSQSSEQPQDAEDYHVQTAQLYGMAKAFLEAVKSIDYM